MLDQRDIDTIDEAEGWTYHCPNCGDETLLVEYRYSILEHRRATVECTCGEADDGTAAERTYTTGTQMCEWGYLDEDHRVEWEDKEVGDKDDDDDELEVYCASCLEEATDYDWDYDNLTEDDVETVEEEFAVLCGGCKREIEFGWSHSDRGGRIWPAECSDFNPWKSWPEPRFEEAWGQKGWLRPGITGENVQAGVR